MSLKVFQLAKELGIDSKAIVKKCKDEQIPNIETHMSPVTAGLAATIREWFSSGEMKTAIESTAHVDVAKIQKAPRKRTSKKGGASGASGDSATAVAEPPESDTAKAVDVAVAVLNGIAGMAFCLNGTLAPAQALAKDPVTVVAVDSTAAALNHTWGLLSVAAAVTGYAKPG